MNDVVDDVLAGEDHSDTGENVRTQETAALPTAVLGSVRQDQRTRANGNQNVNKNKSKTEPNGHSLLEG